jgi:galactose mutarotase-like enzyme
MEVVPLASGPLAAEVLPGLGGSLGNLAWRGEPVLRGWDGRTRDPNAAALYPLVPWSNRISGGGFRHGGRFHALAANRGGEPFPIHGHGWLAPWTVVERVPGAVRLAHEHGVDGAFRYRATLDYALGGDGLAVTLAVTHEGGAPLPYGLGLHPWLPRDRGGPVLLEAPASAVWLEGPGHLPAARLAPPPEEWDFGAARAAPRLDQQRVRGLGRPRPGGLAAPRPGAGDRGRRRPRLLHAPHAGRRELLVLRAGQPCPGRAQPRPGGPARAGARRVVGRERAVPGARPVLLLSGGC